MKHRLKTWPEFFAAVRDGSKPFEVRRDDRDFNVGDTLELAEWDPTSLTFTGNIECRDVTYIARGGPFTPEGMCVLGLAPNFRMTTAYAANALVADPESVVREVERRMRDRARHDFAIQIDGTKHSKRLLEAAVLELADAVREAIDLKLLIEAKELPAPWAANPKHNDQEAP